MPTHLVRLDFDAALDQLMRCAGCGSWDLTGVSDQDQPNFLCGECHRCWHVELDSVTRVDPRGCLDCPHRTPCLERTLEPVVPAEEVVAAAAREAR